MVSGQFHTHSGHFTLVKRARYPLNIRLCGPQSQHEHCGEQKNLGPARNQTPANQPAACHYTGSFYLSVENNRTSEDVRMANLHIKSKEMMEVTPSVL
jgi:hypothetical protein